jgi:IS1 family transposase
MVSMNRLDASRRAQVIRCQVEGNSIRSTVRMTGVAKNTVANLILEVGAACARYQDEHLRDLTCKRLQADEIWSFMGCKEKQVATKKLDMGVCGSVWTWTAIDADTKLIPCWFIGQRDAGCATAFIQDLAGRLNHRVQLTTDGLKVYLNAILDSFGTNIDYAILHKVYGAERPDAARYSPGTCLGTKKVEMIGDPDEAHVSTSYVERANLTMRMSMRRFTRLTNGFSKKLENHAAAVALHFMWYNFGRIHQTLKMTPAMKAGIAARPWTVEEIVALADITKDSVN